MELGLSERASLRLLMRLFDVLISAIPRLHAASASSISCATDDAMAAGDYSVAVLIFLLRTVSSSSSMVQKLALIVTMLTVFWGN